MPLTHDFKETVRARAQRDPKLRQALLREAVECILNGDLDTSMAVLRDYVNATVGFQDFGEADAYSGQEPDADARAERQSFRSELLQHPDRAAKNGRCCL